MKDAPASQENSPLPADANAAAPARPLRWYRCIGPGLITACVVIGPGSILTSSKTGAQHGYALVWVVVVAVFFMANYTLLGAKLGVVSQSSTGDLVTRHAGRWLAVLIGGGVFFISAAFQFGNNLGVHSALSAYIDFDYTVVIFNLLAIAFLFAFKNLYRALERLMMGFVGLMLLAFALNLCFARPHLGELLRGFVPRPLATSHDFVLLFGLVGTTFVTTVAFFQSYLVQQKGWRRDDLAAGRVDVRIGSTIMAVITLMIMCTSAAVLRGKQLNGVGDVGVQLRPLFGGWGQLLFCLGLFSAAYSSFIVNSMIGGFMLADGLGIGSHPSQRAPRLLTTVVLLTGMFFALYAIRTEKPPVAAIVAAQAVTVLASPLLAGTLLWLTNRKDVMGTERNGVVTNVIAGLGFILLLGMAYYLATEKVWPFIAEAIR